MYYINISDNVVHTAITDIFFDMLKYNSIINIDKKKKMNVGSILDTCISDPDVKV